MLIFRTNFNRKPVSNFKLLGKSCDHISNTINVCFAVAIVINKLSHLSDRVCNSCRRGKVRNLFQLFHLVKNSTKEESVQSPDRFVSTAITVFCFALSAKPCKSQSVSNRLTCNRPQIFTAKSAVFYSARTESTSTKR